MESTVIAMDLKHRRC